MENQVIHALISTEEYRESPDFMNVNLSDFALFLAVMKHKEAQECVLSIILDEPDLRLTQVRVEDQCHLVKLIGSLRGKPLTKIYKL